MRWRSRLLRRLHADPAGLALVMAHYLRELRRARSHDGALDDWLASSSLGALHVGEGVLEVAVRGVDWLAPTTCLPRAMARYRVLRACGEPVHFVIAVDPSRIEAKMDAIGHAWVELDGRPWLEPGEVPSHRTFEWPVVGRGQ